MRPTAAITLAVICLVAARCENDLTAPRLGDGAQIHELTPAAKRTPKGKIVFSSNRAGHSQIYRMNPDGSEIVRLTDYPEPDGLPAWSHNAKKIAFQRWDPLANTYHIHSMNADGGVIVRLTDDTEIGGAGQADWSPNSRHIVFQGDNEICRMHADGTGIECLMDNTANDFAPAWSPKGKQIAFVSDRDGPNTENFEIYVMSADGSNVVRLTYSVGTDNSPAWSPRGDKIVFTSWRDGNSEIYVMDSDGTNQIRLTNHPAADYSPTWSRDGQQIAFTSLRHGNFEIYVMSIDGTGVTRITNHSATDHFADWR